MQHLALKFMFGSLASVVVVMNDTQIAVFTEDPVQAFYHRCENTARRYDVIKNTGSSKTIVTVQDMILPVCFFFCGVQSIFSFRGVVETRSIIAIWCLSLPVSTQLFNSSTSFAVTVTERKG